MSRIGRNLVHLITGTTISRLLGFVRELVIAAVFGAGTAVDLFVVAFTVPSFFRRILGEDVVERAFIPPFKAALVQGEQRRAWRLLSNCLNTMVVVSLLVLLGLYLTAPFIVRMIAPGLTDALRVQAVTMTYWVLPFTLLIALAAFVGGILNIFEINRVYSLAPAMLNIGVIGGVWLLEPRIGILALPAGFLLGGFGQLVVQIPFLRTRAIRDAGASYWWLIERDNSEFRVVRRESLFILLKSMLDKSVDVVDRVLASFLLGGSLSALWFSQRLIQLPLAVVGLGISRAMIPLLVEEKARGQDDRFAAYIHHGVRLNLVVLIPIAACSILAGDAVVGLLFERGAFDSEDTGLTTLSFCAYALGLPAMGVHALLSRSFSVLQTNRVALRIAGITAVCNIGLSALLVKTPLAHGGLALASAISFVVSAMMMYRILDRDLARQLKSATAFAETGWLLAVSGACMALTWWLCFDRLAIDTIFSTPGGRRLLTIVAIPAVFLPVYLAGLRWLGPPVIREMLQRRQLFGVES